MPFLNELSPVLPSAYMPPAETWGVSLPIFFFNDGIGGLFFVRVDRAMRAAHAAGDRTAVDALHGPVAVNMLPGGGLEAAVAVGA